MTRKSASAKFSKTVITVPRPLARRPKVLIVAHNHPRFFPGGAEIIAYDLFKALRAGGRYESFFLAGSTAADCPPRVGTPFQSPNHAPDEMIFRGSDFDYFYQSQNVAPYLHQDFREFLLESRPDVVHFHHTMRVGIEALTVVRQTLPEARIVYTLHEFILMCHRDGQMVRRHTGDLCDRATPTRCHQCFPEITPQAFKMRESFIKAHLEAVDIFVSPSHFLKQRFTEWGLPPERIAVIENGRPLVQPAPPRALAKGQNRNAFAYFGQINPYKGAMLALSAAESLLKDGFDDFRLDLFGNVEQQSDAFREVFFALIDRHRRHIRFHGKYDNADMGRLLANVDWVIVPSTWWENSPLVIQEAFMHKRPVLCSDIGGMAEKVEHERTGLHFKARSETSLAQAMQRAATESGLWQRLADNIGPRLSVEECARLYTDLYDRR